MSDDTARTQWAGRPSEAFLDDDHAFSMGRLIAFVGVCLAVELIQAGLFLTFYALFRPDIIAATAVGTGMGVVGIGAGFFTGGALLKFGTKNQEDRFQAPFRPEADGGFSAPNSHV